MEGGDLTSFLPSKENLLVDGKEVKQSGGLTDVGNSPGHSCQEPKPGQGGGHRQDAGRRLVPCTKWALPTE